MTRLSPGLSVVVPVFNSALSLAALAQRLHATLGARPSEYELIFVNDGSRDHSWDVICGLLAPGSSVRGVNLMRNYGQHNALLCGIRLANYDVIVTIDDDLQHPPEEIPKLLETLAKGHDVVYGTPQQEQHGFMRDLASHVTKLALRSAMGSEVAGKASAFRVFRTQLRKGFANYNGPFVSIDVLLTWATTRFAAEPVRHDPRRLGVSNYTVGKLLAHALNMTTGFSTLPLQLASWIGFACTLFGVGVLAFVIGRYLREGGSVPGFPFLASLVAIFSGAQLFSLGIIGEYLARMHFRIMATPAYVIQSQLGPKRGQGSRTVSTTEQP